VTARALTVVVPARNEEARLPHLFATLSNGGLQALERAGLHVTELLVVDDGSTDGTAALVAEQAARDPRVRLVRTGAGRGKGAAVRAGMLAAAAPWALVTDADLATPLEEAAALARELEAGADVAIGSRGLPDSTIVVHQPRHRELAGKTFNLLVRAATGLPYRDTQCGFKLFRLATTRVLFEGQREHGFAFDVELLLEARRRGLRVAEVPVRWVDDPQTRVRFASASREMTVALARITVRDRRRRQGTGARRRAWHITKQGGRAE
jgi:dolichyl-phosphate beta-glucosyltransferase